MTVKKKNPTLEIKDVVARLDGQAVWAKHLGDRIETLNTALGSLNNMVVARNRAFDKWSANIANSVRQHSERISVFATHAKHLEDRLIKLEQIPAPTNVAWESAIKNAVAHGVARVSEVGARVKYWHADSTHSTWSGDVIARPHTARRYSVDGTPLVYVVRDGDLAVRGCLPENLVLVHPASDRRA